MRENHMTEEKARWIAEQVCEAIIPQIMAGTDVVVRLRKPEGYFSCYMLDVDSKIHNQMIDADGEWEERDNQELEKFIEGVMENDEKRKVQHKPNKRGKQRGGGANQGTMGNTQAR